MAGKGDFAEITVEGVQSAIEKALREYGDVVYVATEAGLDAGEAVLIDALKSASPTKTGKFAKAWKSSGKKYKLLRVVGNSTTVKGKGGSDIPLINILEYSTTRGNAFVRSTYENNVDNIAAAIVAEIKKEV